jgi:hypothetical protein
LEEAIDLSRDRQILDLTADSMIRDRFPLAVEIMSLPAFVTDVRLKGKEEVWRFRRSLS